MKIQNLIKASIAALVFGTASHAMADVITLNASGLPTNGYLTAGKYNGSFNGSGLLPKAYTVDSLKFDFAFKDDGDDPFSSINGFITSSETLESTTGKDRFATLTTTYFVPVIKEGEGESVALTIGGLSFLKQTKAGGTTSTPSDPVVGDKLKGKNIWVKGSGKDTVQCNDDQIKHDNSCKEVPYYTVTKTIVTTNSTDYTGMISFSGDLLASLFQNDKLDFALDVTGDLFLTNASLGVTFTPDAVLPPAGVPEPASVALFGIAMLGAFGASRKRRV